MIIRADRGPGAADESVAAVIVAGGAGRRIGGEPKQFRTIGARPMLAWSCARFSRHADIREVVVVVPGKIAADPPDWLCDADVHLAVGGETRRASVHAGLEALARVVEGSGESMVREGRRVLIHDAARPFVSADLVSRVVRAAREGPAIPVLTLADAIKQVASRRGDEASVVRKTLDRGRLRAAQTPQGFPLDLILRLHREVEDGEGMPDDAALCERAGLDVRTVQGERWAWKITHPEDLAIAEWLVASGRIVWPGGAT